MKQGEFEIQIPFAGFYCSFHEDEVNREHESFVDWFTDESGENIPESLSDAFFTHANWENGRHDYANEYAESFLEYYGLGGEFTGMESPRFYNFSTDRVFVKVDRDTIARLWKETDRGLFVKYVNRRHTSRDGFISHYSNDWHNWGRLSNWDHNQLNTLLLAWLETYDGKEFDQWEEISLMENYMCNGGVAIAIQSDGLSRVYRIAEYLIERSKRPIRTLDQWHAARRAENRPFELTPLGAWQ
jgi:hypothetical protein